MSTVRTRFACRRRTAAEWAALNEVLLLGEWGVETDLLPDGVKAKMGDGVTAWNDLAYAVDTTAIGSATFAGLTGAPDDNTALAAALDAHRDAAIAAAAQDATDKVAAEALLARNASNLTSGTIDIARLPAGALDRLVQVANQAARYALTTATVQLGDSVKELDTGLLYVVVDEANLGNASGYVTYTAGAAASVPWTGVTSKPQTLVDIAAAPGADGDVHQKVGGSWVSRTMAQFKVTLAMTVASISDFASAVASQITAALTNTSLSGNTSLQMRELRADLAQGYVIPNPTRQHDVAFDITTPATIGWTRLFTLVGGDATASLDRIRVSGGIGVATAPSVGGDMQFTVDTTSVLGAYSTTNFFNLGHSIPTTGYLRVYRDVDGSGRPRVTAYFYQSTALARHIWAQVTALSSNALDEITVWPAGDTFTTTDPIGAAIAEITLTSNIAGTAAMDARLFLNTLGVPADPVRGTDTTSAATSYSLTSADHMTRIRFTAATAVTVTVDTGVVSSGFYCELVQDGAGQVIVVAGSGMTQKCAGTAKSRALYSPMAIDGQSTTIYYVTGDMSAS